jgi:hypothetical protein
MSEALCPHPGSCWSGDLLGVEATAGCAQSLDQLAAEIDGRVPGEVDALRYRR